MVFCTQPATLCTLVVRTLLSLTNAEAEGQMARMPYAAFQLIVGRKEPWHLNRYVLAVTFNFGF